MKRASSSETPDAKRQQLIADMHYDFIQKLEILKFPTLSHTPYPVPGMANIELLLRNRIGRVLALPSTTEHYMSDVLLIEAEPEARALYAVQNFCARSGPLTLIVYRPFYWDEERGLRYWDNLYSLCAQNRPCILVLDHINRFTDGSPQLGGMLLNAMFDVNHRRATALSAETRLDRVWTVVITDSAKEIRIKHDAIARYVTPAFDEQHRCVVDELRRRLRTVAQTPQDTERIERACASCAELLEEICVPIRRSGIQGGTVVQPGIFETYERVVRFVSRSMQQASDTRGSPIPTREDMETAAQRISDAEKEDLLPE